MFPDQRNAFVFIKLNGFVFENFEAFIEVFRAPPVSDFGQHRRRFDFLFGFVDDFVDAAAHY